MATANGIKLSTAYAWVRSGQQEAKQRGGRRHHKVQQHHIETMLTWLSENPLLSLKEIKDRLRMEHNISLCSTTIHNHLDGQFFTCKKIRTEPFTMNSEVNKAKRAEYVEQLMAFIGEGKTIVYIDETNCNLFLRRNVGRSRKGTRCCVKAATSKGKNIHIIAGISQTGLVYWERRRGSYNNADCCEWLRRLLRSMDEQMDRVVIVCDNAPAHTNLELVPDEDEFHGVTILRAAPYSAPLNPIEECWSVVKASMKRQMAATFAEMMAVPPGDTTQTEYRLKYLEAAIDEAVTSLTPILCLRTCNHVQKHFAACLVKADLAMGV